MKKLFICFGICLLATFTLLAQDALIKKKKDRDPATYYHLSEKHHLNIGIGLINIEEYSFSLFSATGSGKPSPSINISYDYGLSRQFSIGLMTSYYRVNAQEELSLDIANFENLFEDILADPACYSACVLGINLGGADCNCSVDGKVTQRTNVLNLVGKFGFHFFRFEDIDTYTTAYFGYSFNRRKTITEQSLEVILEQADIVNDFPTFIYFVSAGARIYITPEMAAFGEIGYGNSHILQLGMTYRFMD